MIAVQAKIWLGKNEDMDQNATAKDNLDAKEALDCRKVFYMSIFSISTRDVS